jgi:cation:H+ antiporter
MILWLELALCASVIVFCGTRLSRYGDILAVKTGMGGSWVGLVLMASVTSLPELITGISAVTYAEVPDIAVGNVLGACTVNLLLFALLDAFHRPAPLSSKAHQGQVLAAAFGIVLIATTALSIFLGPKITPLGWVGPYSLFFGVVYFSAVRIIYLYERRQIASYVKEAVEERGGHSVSLKRALLLYGANAVCVIAAALFLPGIGEDLASSTGLGQTFVGTVLIAFSTTLPEITVSLAAVRLGAVDMAIANIFGSNIFNIFILAVDDLFFLKGPLLSFVSPNHLVSALSAVAMAAIAIIGLTYRAERKKLLLAWDSACIVIVYVINLMMLYSLR